jgi:FMN phosphatase YigB (HAD superfamily)
MSARHDLVFLFDVDNTLLDNDRLQSDLLRHLAREVWSQDSNPLRGDF